MLYAARKLRVLVVDDDEAFAKLVGVTLANEFETTHEVRYATDPAQVWGSVAQREVDLCVTDMDMPDIDGFMLLKHLKEFNPLAQVIFLTAYPTLEAARSAFTLGADDFLTKPVNFNTLFNAVLYLSSRINRWQLDMIYAE